MNKRIQELMVELKKTVSTHRGDAVLIGYDEIEKFAELIVRECVDIVYEIGDYSNGLTKNKTSRNGLFASVIGKTIKEKFGVE